MPDDEERARPLPAARTMIAFDAGDARFNCRVVGVALHEGRVLLHRAETEDFWSLPGGRAELLEPATDTLRREMREELGVEVAVERLLWVVENFFDYDAKSYHELALYFLMTLPHDSPLRQQREPFLGDEEGLILIFRWHTLDELRRTTIYPTFLREALRSLPATTAHIVHHDAIAHAEPQE